MRYHTLMLAVLPLAASCSEDAPAPDPGKIAEIERVNEGVVVPARPQPILYPDIEAHKLTEPACAFAPERGGMAPILLAMEGKAVMKFSGEIAEFAPDNGAAKGPAVAWTKYDGRGYSIRLGLGQEVTGAASGKRYEASLELRDGKDRTAYTATGYAQCPG